MRCRDFSDGRLRGHSGEAVVECDVERWSGAQTSEGSEHRAQRLCGVRSSVLYFVGTHKLYPVYSTVPLGRSAAALGAIIVKFRRPSSHWM